MADLFHDRDTLSSIGLVSLQNPGGQFTYTFENFFHPYTGRLIGKLNKESLPGMMDAKWQETELFHVFFNQLYHPDPQNSAAVQVDSFPKEIDVRYGPYANYNWELLFHIPLTIAVHLSKNQRFTEAQRWFHYIFDPTSNDLSEDPPKRFWKFIAFRNPENNMRIEEIVRLLSKPFSQLSREEQADREQLLAEYNNIRNHPFQPHAVAQTRHLAYQYNIVMKYLDNLVAWGDHLFQQDTVESINEASQIYVLAANILGERPQKIPPQGKVKAKSFAKLREEGLGPIGNALVDMEGQFPLNIINTATGSTAREPDQSNVLFGIGRTLYFCIPRNEKLLNYWDKVADRLFKIRHCMNIAGVVRPLALFDPPLDPGMLVKAAAAGINIGNIINGLNQPVGPVRSLYLIQKALELCSEVRNLGNTLLSTLEKGEAEKLSLLRQRHETQIQEMAQHVRFLQLKATQEATNSLLTSRRTALQRLNYYKRLLGLQTDPNIPDTLTPDRRELNEENFDEAFSVLVGQYDRALTLQNLPSFTPVGSTSPQQQSGASGDGRLYLNSNESVDLHDHKDRALAARISAAGAEGLAAILSILPNIDIAAEFWGVGARNKIKIGDFFAHSGRAISSGFNIWAQIEEWQGLNASKTASYERRADEWMLQYNLAAHELMQIGRQILTSLIAEQIARHEYQNIKQQIRNAREVDQFLHDKFTNEELYLWMQGEISRLYYEHYRFAFDTARRAEKAMKQELMRPELDNQDFVKFNYWDVGRKGLLSGEALYLDLKKMEMAYHDNNKRELELTKHVSLRRLSPIALLSLKATGSCQITIPEWLYDVDCPGHYLRRIKSVALSIPSVVGPYTNVHCTLSLLKSTLRKSPLPKDGAYIQQGSEDDRFINYTGAVQSIVTSGAINDSGLFETNLRDERFLPFENAGAESTWKLDLPNDYRSFDYNTISDVILHIRYTARQGVEPAKVKSALDELFQSAGQAGLSLLFSLKHDFPTEWSLFVNSNGRSNFSASIRRDFFPYFTQGKTIAINRIELYGQNITAHHTIGGETEWSNMTGSLGNSGAFTVTTGPTAVLSPAAGDFFLIVMYSFSSFSS